MVKHTNNYRLVMLRKMSKKEFREYMIQAENEKVRENKNNHSPVKDK